MAGRQPPFDLLGEDRTVRWPTRGTGGVTLTAVMSAVIIGLSGCTAQSSTSSPDPTATQSGTTPADNTPGESGSPSPTPGPTRASAVPTPAVGACYRLSFDEALAPTSDSGNRDCATTHTARTTFVGRLNTVVNGHLLAVDSDRLQADVAADCPGRVAAFLGGRTDRLRLTMLRPVWFTPTLEQSDAGADWYRCDVTAVAGDEELAPLTGRLQGILDRPRELARYAMCGTAEPGTEAFQRVVCSRRHSWRAIKVIDLGEGGYPGPQRARDAGQQPCDEAARQLADDALDYEWGYEWPTAEQWASGQTFGLCWHPDAGNGVGSG